MKTQWLWVGIVSLGLAGCALTKSGEKAEEKEGPEIKMSIDQVPPAVKATIVREAEGATVTSVDKQTDEGKNLYEADAMIQGKNYEIIVAEDGSLVTKKFDDEAAEKKGAATKPSEKKESKEKD